MRRHSPRRTTSRIRWHGLGDPEVEVITISLTQRSRRAFDNPGDGKRCLSLPGWRTRSVRRSGTESSQTLCWRKADSNRWSPSKRDGLSFALIEIFSGAARPTAKPTVGLRVRIRLAPPVSPSQRGPADAVGQSRGSGAGLSPTSGREKRATPARPRVRSSAGRPMDAPVAIYRFIGEVPERFEAPVLKIRYRPCRHLLDRK